MKTKRGFTLTELIVTIAILVAFGVLAAAGLLQSHDSDKPFLESYEGKRNRMLERQAEAMERQNELLERSINRNQGAERR